MIKNISIFTIALALGATLHTMNNGLVKLEQNLVGNKTCSLKPTISDLKKHIIKDEDKNLFCIPNYNPPKHFFRKKFLDSPNVVENNEFTYALMNKHFTKNYNKGRKISGRDFAIKEIPTCFKNPFEVLAGIDFNHFTSTDMQDIGDTVMRVAINQLKNGSKNSLIAQWYDGSKAAERTFETTLFSTMEQEKTNYNSNNNDHSNKKKLLAICIINGLNNWITQDLYRSSEPDYKTPLPKLHLTIYDNGEIGAGCYINRKEQDAYDEKFFKEKNKAHNNLINKAIEWHNYFTHETTIGSFIYTVYIDSCTTGLATIGRLLNYIDPDL